MKRWQQYLFTAVSLLGFLLILGTADAEYITFSRSIIQSLVGLAMFAGGAYLGGLMN